MNNTLTMTKEQTKVYDEGDHEALNKLMTELFAEARHIVSTTGIPVEIYTADGVMVAFTE